MQLPFRRNHPRPEPFWRRLDRVAGEINPFLLIVAVGLVILYLSCAVGLLVKLPHKRIGDTASCPTEAVQPSSHTFSASGF